MTHTEILKLIENVAPDDAAMLDEIDARVWCWLEGWAYNYCDFDNRFNCFVMYASHKNYLTKMLPAPPHYTRSRDALKAIRPRNGWVFSTTSFGKCKYFNLKNPQELKYCIALTEELAELHAIIRAIAYERGLHD